MCLYCSSCVFALGTENKQEGSFTKSALLVGCNDYSGTDRVGDLRGPSNDIRLFENLLLNDFGFARENIVALSDRLNDSPPTKRNIKTEFEKLIERTKSGDQLFILFSGHGTQVPVVNQSSEEAKGELDGMDEAFIPGNYSDKLEPNNDSQTQSEFFDSKQLILDNQFHIWLSALVQRGAEVWIIFDCCHAGTITRGLQGERKAKNPILRQGSRKLNKKSGNSSLQSLDGVAFDYEETSSVSKGSLVAFFASQPYESAFESAVKSLDGRTIVQSEFSTALYEVMYRQKCVTYRDLIQAVKTKMRTGYGHHRSTPICEGDLDRVILGQGAIAGRGEIYLKKEFNRHIITAGQLHGIRSKTKLVAKNRDGKRFGIVVVREADYTKSVVVAEDPKIELPDHCLCEIVQLAEPDIELMVAADDHSEKFLASILDSMSDRKVPLSINFVDKDADTAALQLKYEVPTEKYVLSRRHEREWLQLKGYGRGDTKWLKRDLVKIQKWYRLNRVASETDSGASVRAEKSSISAELKMADGSAISPNGVAVGKRMQMTLKNLSKKQQWIGVLYLSPDFSVKIWANETLNSGQELDPFTWTVNGDTIGPEGLVVLAAPFVGNRIQPDFEAFAQTFDSQRSGEVIPIEKFDKHANGFLERLLSKDSLTRGASKTTDTVLSFFWTSIEK